jgi:hypothetical protein
MQQLKGKELDSLVWQAKKNRNDWKIKTIHKIAEYSTVHLAKDKQKKTRVSMEFLF